jgi:hypothetical protein
MEVLMDNGHEEILAKIKELKDEFSNKMQKLETMLLDPDTGVYIRINKNTVFRRNVKKWLLFIGTTSVGLLLLKIYNLVEDIIKRYSKM